MAKTLLQIVKNTLEAMDSDTIDTIYLGDGGTEESEQIASFAAQLYEYMHSIYDWPHSKILAKLDSLADSEKPNYLKVPKEVSEILWVKYRGKDITWITPEAFINLSNGRLTLTKDDNGVYTESMESDTVEVLSFDDVRMFIKTNSDPTYYTSFDNEHLVFDSYDINNDTTLQQTNNTIYAVKSSVFSLDDQYIPDFPEGMYPLFQAELNRESHLRLKQVDSPVDAKRALVSMAVQRSKIDKINKQAIPGFGRK